MSAMGTTSECLKLLLKLHYRDRYRRPLSIGGGLLVLPAFLNSAGNLDIVLWKGKQNASNLYIDLHNPRSVSTGATGLQNEQ